MHNNPHEPDELASHPRTGGRRITGHDVARSAGVSQSTVSRALRNDPRLLPETRARIFAVADELGYVPQESGRVLARSAPGRVAVMFSADDLANPFHAQLLASLQSALDESGYRTLLLAEGPSALDAVLDGSVAGVVLTATHLTSPLPAQLLRHGVPYVLVNREVEPSSSDACTVDNRHGGRLAARLVCELGHRDVALVLGPADLSTVAARDAGARAGLGPSASVRSIRGELNHDTGYYAGRQLLDDRRPPTAVICSNDLIAIGVLQAAAAGGVAVPGQLTVIGFDDVPMATWHTVQLTTVRYDVPAMARFASRMLARRLLDPSAPRSRVKLAPSLVLRGTHGLPPVSS